MRNAAPPDLAIIGAQTDKPISISGFGVLSVSVVGVRLSAEHQAATLTFGLFHGFGLATKILDFEPEATAVGQLRVRDWPDIHSVGMGVLSAYMATPSNIGTLLVDAPVGRHFAQLHRDDDTLMVSVSKFVEAGLRRRTGVVVIATPEHTDTLVAKLSRVGLDAEDFRRSGQLGVYDASATLERCMRSGMPQWADFRRVVGAAIELAQSFGGGVRAYGEMVNLLWREGKPEAAIKVEEFWNELAKLYPFCLFCGYVLDSQHPSCYHGPLHEIGRTHSDVIATHDDDRFGVALDSACQDVFGIPLSQMLSLSGREDHPGEARLPVGQRTMLWITRHMQASSAEVLERTKRYYSAAAH